MKNIKTRKQKYKEIVLAIDKGLNAYVIELIEDYLKEFPNSQGGWDIYSLALYRTDRFKEAKKALQKSIKLLDETKHKEILPWLFCRMGQIYKDSGNFTKAIEWYQKAHLANQQEATFLIYQGVMLLRKEKVEEAVKVFQKAIKCDEGCIDEAFYNLGVAYLIQRNYVEAKICFEKTLKIDPKFKKAKSQFNDISKVLEMI